MPMKEYNCAFEYDVDEDFDWDTAFNCARIDPDSAAEEFAQEESAEEGDSILVRDKKTGEIYECTITLRYEAYKITKLAPEAI